MNPDRIFAKAEAFKRKSHRLSLDLRLKSPNDAAGFVREHGVVLWNAKAELPNLLDAIIGRIAGGRERVYGKPAENCYRWREELIRYNEFLECRFFSKLSTVIHQDLWPFATVVARINRQRAENGHALSKEARRIMTFLQREGPTRTDKVRKALKFSTKEQGRLFHRAKKDLQNRLILLGKEDVQSSVHTHAEILDFWENWMPKSVRAKADQIDENFSRLKLLSATLTSCVLTNENRISRWFAWSDESMEDALDNLVKKKDFIRIVLKKENWIVSRKVLGDS